MVPSWPSGRLIAPGLPGRLGSRRRCDLRATLGYLPAGPSGFRRPGIGHGRSSIESSANHREARASETLLYAHPRSCHGTTHPHGQMVTISRLRSPGFWIAKDDSRQWRVIRMMVNIPSRTRCSLLTKSSSPFSRTGQVEIGCTAEAAGKPIPWLNSQAESPAEGTANRSVVKMPTPCHSGYSGPTIIDTGWSDVRSDRRTNRKSVQWQS